MTIRAFHDEPDNNTAGRLREQIDATKRKVARLRAYNASCRMKKGELGDLSLLDADQLRELQGLSDHQLGRYGEFPRHHTTKLNATIRQFECEAFLALMERLDWLESRQPLGRLQ